MIPDGLPVEVFAAQLIFWILLPAVLFAPTRWAVVGWLLMGNLDATGPSEIGSETIGVINAVKGVILPLILCWRLRAIPTLIPQSLAARLWISLTIYAAIAVFWSSFPTAAIKLVGNMIGLLLAIIVIERSVHAGLLRSKLIVTLVTASLALGCLQTFYFGGTSYGFDGFDQPLRFSSFVAAQQYGAFLVAFLALILWHRAIGSGTKLILAVALWVALALNGSRTWFLGALLVMLFFLWSQSRRFFALGAFGFASVLLCILLTLNLTRYDVDVFRDTPSRLIATFSAVFLGQDTDNNSGLRNLAFRLAIYDGVVADLQGSSTSQILVGHGTSSGGAIASLVFPDRYRNGRVDPNRTIHNEWLRALYEWGLIGFSLFVGTFISVLVGLRSYYRDPRYRVHAVAVLSFLPAFLAALATENIVAGAGNAVTMSFALLIGSLRFSQPVNVTPR